MFGSLRGRVVGVVGWKDAGKTTVVERLLRYLSTKGFRVGTVKHVHDEITLQPQAKDSVKHLDAGAVCTVVLGPGLSVILDRNAYNLEEAIAHYLFLCDYVVVEGFKEADIPKVAVASGNEGLIKDIENVVGVVCADDPPEGHTSFTFEEIDKLGDFLFEKGILTPSSKGASLIVNGESVPMNDFVETSLSGVVQGFLASLRGIDKPSTIQLAIKLAPSSGGQVLK